MIVLLIGCVECLVFEPQPTIRPPSAWAYTESTRDGLVLLHVHGYPPMDDVLPAPPEGGRLIDFEIRTAAGELVEVVSTEVAYEGLTLVLGPVEPGLLTLTGQYEFPGGPAVEVPSDVTVHKLR